MIITPYKGAVMRQGWCYRGGGDNQNDADNL